MTRFLLAALMLTVPAGAPAGLARPLQSGMVRIEAGSFRPLYRQPGEDIVKIAAFAIDTVPVSQSQFMAFVRRNPQWAAGRVSNRLADAGYLKHATSSATRPVTRVSWHAAKAYCSERGARLPTTNEWEYVAMANEEQRNASADPSFRQHVLELSMKSDPHAFTIGSGMRNVWGVRDMHGGITEWTHDFGHHKHGENCAAGTLQTGDASDYAAFMRYAFRSVAQGTTTASNTGFRCASGA